MIVINSNRWLLWKMLTLVLSKQLIVLIVCKVHTRSSANLFMCFCYQLRLSLFFVDNGPIVYDCFFEIVKHYYSVDSIYIFYFRFHAM